MKWLPWTAFLLSALAHSEIEIKASQMHYRWGSNASFPLTAYQVGYTEYLNNYGFRILGGESDTKTNTVGGIYQQETQKMKRFFVGNIHKRFIWPKGFSSQIGINYTEYQSCSDSYGCNADTGIGYGIALQKRISQEYAVKLSYDDLYRKQHKVLGKEITRSVAISLVVGL